MREPVKELLRENEPSQTEVIEGHLLMEFDPGETDKESVREISRAFNGSFYETKNLSGDLKTYGV